MIEFRLRQISKSNYRGQFLFAEYVISKSTTTLFIMYVIVLYSVIGLNICNAFITEGIFDSKKFQNTILNENYDENPGKLSNNLGSERDVKGNDVLDLLMELNNINEIGESKENNSELKVKNHLEPYISNLYPSNLAKIRRVNENEEGAAQSKKEKVQNDSKCDKGNNQTGGKWHLDMNYRLSTL